MLVKNVIIRLFFISCLITLLAKGLINIAFAQASALPIPAQPMGDDIAYSPVAGLVAQNYDYPAPNWVGWYIGIYYGYRDPLWNDSFSDLMAQGTDLAGLVIGYNDQRNTLVYGLDVDSFYAKPKDSFFVLPVNEKQEIALGPRLGLDLGAIVPYVTMGFVMDNRQDFISGSQAGMAGGIGLDLRLTSFFISRIEWRHVNYSMNYVHDKLVSKPLGDGNNLLRLGMLWKL